MIFERAGEGGADVLRFNEKFECKTCDMEFAHAGADAVQLQLPVGACPRCQGFGNTIDFDLDLVIPDTRSRSTKARSIRGPSRSTARGIGNFKKQRARAACASTCRSAT